MEHILRNAIDHGIEPADQRAAAGKDVYGRISINLKRDGSYMLLTITDDGQGIDFQAVSKQALEKGLITSEVLEQYTEEEFSELLFLPGFSTAKSVTQISGRGIGMDVVRQTIREMGGSINLRSQPGRGTQFELSIPFTLSVNRALMVHIGEDTYALPLLHLRLWFG